MKGDIVTVFGGSGFVGRHVVRRLAKDGARVRVAVRRPNLAHFVRPMGDVGQVQIFQANVNDDDSVARALDGADAAINLVGVLYQSGGGQKFDAVHTQAPGRIGRAATAAGVKRLVHLSALGADLDSTSHYAKSKAEGEIALREAYPGATVLRPSIVFGPEDQFYNRFASLARISPVLPLIGGGHTRFQPVYVGDVADAVLRCTADTRFAGKVFELGGPNVYTFREILEFILATVGRKRLLLPLPFGIAKLKATFLGLLPNPLLTRDQVELLKTDNVVAPRSESGAMGFGDLGIAPVAPEAIVPEYLARFRKTGQFAEAKA